MTKRNPEPEVVLDALVLFGRLMKHELSIYRFETAKKNGKPYTYAANVMVNRREVYTVKELSRALGLSERHIKRLIAEKSFPHYKVGSKKNHINLKRGQIVFSEDDYIYWMDKTLPSGLSQLTTKKGVKKNVTKKNHKGRPDSG